jgi:hypothetical protein
MIARLAMQAKRKAGRRRVRFPFLGIWKIAPELLALPSGSGLEHYEAAVQNEEAQAAHFMAAATAQLKGTACKGNGLVCAIVLESAPVQEVNAVYMAVRVKDGKGEGDDDTNGAECDDDAPSEPDSGIEATSTSIAAAAAVEAAAYLDGVFECAETGRRLYRVHDQWFVTNFSGGLGSSHDDADCVVETTDGVLPTGDNEWAVRTVDGSWVNTTLHTTLLTKEDAVVTALENMEQQSGTCQTVPSGED